MRLRVIYAAAHAALTGLIGAVKVARLLLGEDKLCAVLGCCPSWQEAVAVGITDRPICVYCQKKL